MKFRIETAFPKYDFRISHRDKVLSVGSCFAENMAARLAGTGFSTLINPHGIVYNPFSVACSLEEIMNNREYTFDDIFEYKGLFHSFNHHGDFSAVSSGSCLENINMALRKASSFLRETRILIITFGTSWVYTSVLTGEVVANCHKLPEKFFTRQRLNVEEVVLRWDTLLNQLFSYNSSMKVLFTVSPVRHVRDGLHENQLSKSVLFLAIDQLLKNHTSCHYFPSYEIVTDELRDYRFYKEDMVHPASTAIDYIWEKFSAEFFSSDTLTIIDRWNKIKSSLLHRPINADSQEYREFVERTNKQLESFKQEYPYFVITSVLEGRDIFNEKPVK